MKKIFSFIFGAVFVFSASSETGYRNVEWYSTEAECSKKVTFLSVFNKKKEKQLAPKNEAGVKLLREEKAILGMPNRLLYLFLNEIPHKDDKPSTYRLAGIVYEIPTDSVTRLISNFSNIVGHYINVRSDFWEYIQNDVRAEDLELFGPYIIADYKLFYIASEAEQYGEFAFHELVPEEDSTEKNGTLYIYDYNDDTRVYIYDNIIKDKAVVVYVPHEQDY